MKVASQICDGIIAKDIWHYFSDDNYSDQSILEIIKFMAPNFDDSMVFCSFSDEYTDCRPFFTPIITEEGLCYAFNTLNMQEIVTNE